MFCNVLWDECSVGGLRSHLMVRMIHVVRCVLWYVCYVQHAVVYVWCMIYDVVMLGYVLYMLYIIYYGMYVMYSRLWYMCVYDI